MRQNPDAVRAAADAHGQGHIFRWWDELDETWRGYLLEQVAGLDFAELDGLIEKFVLHSHTPDFGELKPAEPVTLPATPEGEAERRRATAIGEDAIRAGHVAALVVAGGLGTRLRYIPPKGTYPAAPITGKSLFQLHAEKIRAASRRLIVSGMSTTGGLLDAEGGWLWLTLILWAFCVFGLAIFFVAARYTARQVRLLPDRLQWVTLAGCRDLPFADIVSVDLGAVRTPRAVTRLGCLVSLFNWRAAGPTLLAASRSDSVLRLTARDGRSFALVLTALHGLGRLLAALRHAGVPMSDEAEKLVRTTTPEPPENVRRRTRVATVVALVLLAITTAIYALGEQQPAKAPRIEAPDAGGPPVTAEQLIEQERLLREMTAARRVMGQALDRYKAAPEKDAPGRSAALKEFEDAKQRFERLKKRFDAAGNAPTAP